MSELIRSPLFLILAGIVAVFLILGLLKHAGRLVIGIVVGVAILIYFGITNLAEVREWVETLLKGVLW